MSHRDKPLYEVVMMWSAYSGWLSLRCVVVTVDGAV